MNTPPGMLFCNQPRHRSPFIELSYNQLEITNTTGGLASIRTSMPLAQGQFVEFRVQATMNNTMNMYFGICTELHLDFNTVPGNTDQSWSLERSSG